MSSEKIRPVLSEYVEVWYASSSKKKWTFHCIGWENEALSGDSRKVLKRQVKLYEKWLSNPPDNTAPPHTALLRRCDTYDWNFYLAGRSVSRGCYRYKFVRMSVRKRNPAS